MNLRKLSNIELNQRMLVIARREKELLAAAIVHIAEVERRKLYYDYNFRSLYTYLTKHAGFSNGSAYRLMDAARMQLQVPDLAEKIEAGKITMNQVRLVQEAARASAKQIPLSTFENSESLFLIKNRSTAINEENSLSPSPSLTPNPGPQLSLLNYNPEPSLLSVDSPLEGQALETDFSSAEEIRQRQDAFTKKSTNSRRVECVKKQELLQSLSGLSAAESQKLVAQKFDVQPKPLSKVNYQKDGSVRVELTFSADEWAEIQSAQTNLSNTLPTGSCSDLIVHLAKTENRKRAKAARPRPGISNLTPAKKKAVLQRDQCCQFRGPVGTAICGSRFHLQVDHIQPIWAGGSNDLENLQVLCGAHNRLKYRNESGIRNC